LNNAPCIIFIAARAWFGMVFIFDARLQGVRKIPCQGRRGIIILAFFSGVKGGI